MVIAVNALEIDTPTKCSRSLALKIFEKKLAEREVRSTSYREFYCPMQDASWLQKGEETANPYMGSSMLQCGTPKRTFQPAQ